MDNQQLQNKITELEKQVQKLTKELKYEEIAHNTLLEEERKKRQVLEPHLQEKDQKIQELIQQITTLTQVLEQDLTSQMEIFPKGQF